MQSTMVVKNIILESGHEGTQYYRLFLRIDNTGKFRTRGSFTFTEDKLMHEGCARWRGSNKEHLASQHQEYYENHTEEILEYAKQRYEELKESKKGYYQENQRGYYAANKEKCIDATKKWKKENFESVCRYEARRQRDLGFEPINEHFEGSHAHHFNKNGIIYIPADLHRSVSHNVFTGRGMEEINKAAFEWLDHELIKEAFDALESQPFNIAPIGKPRKEIKWGVELNGEIRR